MQLLARVFPLIPNTHAIPVACPYLVEHAMTSRLSALLPGSQPRLQSVSGTNWTRPPSDSALVSGIGISQRSFVTRAKKSGHRGTIHPFFFFFFFFRLGMPTKELRGPKRDRPWHRTRRRALWKSYGYGRPSRFKHARNRFNFLFFVGVLLSIPPFFSA